MSASTPVNDLHERHRAAVRNLRRQICLQPVIWGILFLLHRWFSFDMWFTLTIVGMGICFVGLDAANLFTVRVKLAAAARGEG